ncbi:MAG: glycosyltransferase family 39 protein [Nitrospiraceae bacterium]|nr:glycosyltransferase family 39 protein [Nitrospiraceae bacterium]
MRASSGKQLSLLFISGLTLLAYLALYHARSLDDDRLTGWGWCFHGGVAVSVFAAVAVGTVVSYLFAAAQMRIRYKPAVLFVLAFAASSFFWPEPEVIVDASRYFTQAKHLELYGIRYFLEEWGREIEVWTDMPLVPFLYGVIFRVFGEVRVYVQMFTSVLFASSVVLTYLAGKELWDEEVGFYGGLFLLGTPYLYTQVPLMLVDIPSTFFLILAVYLVIRALKRGGATVLFAGFAIFLAFFSKYSTWLMLSVIGVIAAVYMTEGPTKNSGRRELFSRLGYIVLCAVVPIGVVFLYKFSVFSEQIQLLIAYQKPGLKRWGESFLSTFLFQIHPFVTALALFSVYAAARNKDGKYIIVAWLVVLIVLLQIKRIRYSIMVFPMLSLAASYGLCAIKDAGVRRGIAACAMTSSFAVALLAYLPFLQTVSAVNIKEAGTFLNGTREPNVEVFTLTSAGPPLNPAVSVPLLDIFTDKHIVYDYRNALSPADRAAIAASSLRFTLEYRNPSYYLSGVQPESDASVAVISESPHDPLPPEIGEKLTGYRLVRSFGSSERIFRYQTSVRIYEKKADLR